MPPTAAEYRKLADEHLAKVCSFYQAVNVSGEPKPQVAGKRESFQVEGLAPGRYWFALKSFDADNNISDLSNVVAVEVQ